MVNWSPNPEEKMINLIIIGSEGLASHLVKEIRVSLCSVQLLYLF